jgi:hypothetical protein
MCPGTSDAHRGGMNELITIPDPIVALMLTDPIGARERRVHRARGLRQRRQRFERAARLRRLLA